MLVLPLTEWVTEPWNSRQLQNAEIKHRVIWLYTHHTFPPDLLAKHDTTTSTGSLKAVDFSDSKSVTSPNWTSASGNACNVPPTGSQHWRQHTSEIATQSSCEKMQAPTSPPLLCDMELLRGWVLVAPPMTTATLFSRSVCFALWWLAYVSAHISANTKRILTNLGALESSFNNADAATLGLSLGEVAIELRRRLLRRVAEHWMGWTGKRSGKKIHCSKGVPCPSESAASSFTAHGVDKLAQKRRGGGGETSHPQMPKSASADSSPGMAPSCSADARADGDRVHSHSHASTSPRYGFKWISLQLQESLQEKQRWDDSIVEGGYDAHHYYLHCVEIDRGSIRHVIGVHGHMLRKIEDFCGVFIMIADSEDSCEVSLLGLPFACILGAFILKMLERGYYSIMQSLVRHGW